MPSYLLDMLSFILLDRSLLFLLSDCDGVMLRWDWLWGLGVGEFLQQTLEKGDQCLLTSIPLLPCADSRMHLLISSQGVAAALHSAVLPLRAPLRQLPTQVLLFCRSAE